MSNPWEDFSSDTSTAGPWTDFAPQAQSAPSPAVGTTPPDVAFNQDKYGPGLQDTTVPDVAAVYGAGSLAKTGVSALAKGASSLLETSPDLLNAGITKGTLEKMTPQGVNPADYAKTLRDQFLKNDAIGTTPDKSFPKMNSYIQKSGQGVSDALNGIKQASGSDAVTVDAQKVLKPVYDAWSKEVDAIDPNPQVISKLAKYHSALADTAANQGGRLTLDDLHNALQEAGPKTQVGSDAVKGAYKTVYGALANSRDLAAQTVADQADNPALAKNLLDSNAGYSAGMRVIHDIRNASAAGAINAGKSTFSKLGGPTISKYIAAYLGGEGLIKAAEHLTGNEK